MKSHLEKYQTLSKILAAAICDLFPKAQLIHATSTRSGFYADFVFKDCPAQSQLRFIEDRMHTLLKSMPLERLDMVADNLALYMREHGQLMRSQFLKAWGAEVVSVIKIGSFFDLTDRPFETENIKENFKLQLTENHHQINFRGRSEKVTRIEGTIGKARGVKDYLEIGVKEDLFSFVPLRSEFFEEGYEFVWHPKGAKLRRLLLAYWTQVVEEAGFGVIETPRPLSDYLRDFPTPGGVAKLIQYPCENFSNGLFNASDQLLDRALKAGQAPDVEFLLQFIVKTINMLELKWHAYLVRSTKRAGTEGAAGCEAILRNALEKMGLECELNFTQAKKTVSACLEFKIEDAFGFEWTGPSLQLSQSGDQYLIELSLFDSLERLVALLLEQTQGALGKIESRLRQELSRFYN